MSSSNLASLPAANQTWVHSTCTIQSLSNALSNPDVTAIETDILMGADVMASNDGDAVPIMAHPPATSSDLSAKRFMEMVTECSNSDSASPIHKLRKHIKLDFKEMDVVAPTLEYIEHLGSNTPLDLDDKTIYLNADILPGPGCRQMPIKVESDKFINTCFQSLKNQNLKQVSFSLGWRVDCRAFGSYTEIDIQKMNRVIAKHDLLSRCQGVVLAVNARVLAKDCRPFDSILKDLPGVQLLVWTASGEPPISTLQIQRIKSYFAGNQMLNRVGFDCKVEESILKGLFYDKAVQAIGILWNVKGFLSQMILDYYPFAAERAIDSTE